MVNINDILSAVLLKHIDATKWANARFEQIRRVPNTKVGEIGQDFVEELCSVFDFTIEFPETNTGKRSRQSPWDVKIEGITFELKTASEDVSGCFQFNHFRYARPYDAAIVVGIAPQDVLFNVWSKADLATGKAGTLVSMEKSGSASYKLTKRRADLHAIAEFPSVMKGFLESFSA